jgi:hypothetical protein
VADVKRPANDNLPVANDNRAKYMRDYMKRRRRGLKTLRDLLRDGLQVIEARDAHEDAQARAFIAAARERLDGPEKRKRSRKGMRT